MAYRIPRFLRKQSQANRTASNTRIRFNTTVLYCALGWCEGWIVILTKTDQTVIKWNWGKIMKYSQRCKRCFMLYQICQWRWHHKYLQFIKKTNHEILACMHYSEWMVKNRSFCSKRNTEGLIMSYNNLIQLKNIVLLSILEVFYISVKLYSPQTWISEPLLSHECVHEIIFTNQHSICKKIFFFLASWCIYMLPLFVAKAATDSSEDTTPTGQNSIRDNQVTQMTSQWSFSQTVLSQWQGADYI